VADVESLIRQGVDVLLVSPKESAGLTGVVLEAIDKKIPVIVLDRNVNTDKYNSFIGGDNVVIGKAAGQYAVKTVRWRRGGQGNIVELWEEWGPSLRMIGMTDSTNLWARNPESNPCCNRSTAIGNRQKAMTL